MRRPEDRHQRALLRCSTARRRRSPRPSRRCSPTRSSALFEGPAFKVATRLLGLETTTWIAADGRPLLELAMHGGAHFGAGGRSARAALPGRGEPQQARRDGRVQPAARRADRRSRAGCRAWKSCSPGCRRISTSTAIRACRRAADRLECRIDRSGAASRRAIRQRYLEPTLAAPSVLAEISRLRARSPPARRATSRRIARLARVDGRQHREGSGRRLHRRRRAARAARRMPGPRLSLRRVRARARYSDAHRERHRLLRGARRLPLPHLERGLDRRARLAAGRRDVRPGASPTPRTSS